VSLRPTGIWKRKKKNIGSDVPYKGANTGKGKKTAVLGKKKTAARMFVAGRSKNATNRADQNFLKGGNAKGAQGRGPTTKRVERER